MTGGTVSSSVILYSPDRHLVSETRVWILVEGRGSRVLCRGSRVKMSRVNFIKYFREEAI